MNSSPSSTASFQSTLPARGATNSVFNANADCHISIHAPRTGSDHCIDTSTFSPRPYFNPRSPHGERRGDGAGGQARRNFNPRSPHGERRGSSLRKRRVPAYFNPRSPHGERPAPPQSSHPCFRYFNPRSPHGERPDRVFQSVPEQPHFNPRSPHGERPFFHIRSFADRNFNPRSPHGERLRKVTILSIRIIGFAQKVYHKTVLLRISLAENAVILPEKPRNPVRTSLQKAGGLRFARAIRAARPYSISSPSGA